LSLSIRFPHQNPVHASSLHHPSYMPRPSHSSRFCHTHNSGWGLQIIALLIMKFPPHPCHVLKTFTEELLIFTTHYLETGSCSVLNKQ
jgi:hypothetical protein